MGPKEVHNYLTRVMYNRRNKLCTSLGPMEFFIFQILT